MKYRMLNPDRIIETQRRLQQRIAKRFPGSGLSEVAEEVLRVTTEAAERADEIRRPHLKLRIGIGLVLVIALGIAVAVCLSVRMTSSLDQATDLVQFMEAALGIVVFLGVALVYLVTLETRVKRTRALRALHELRAVAHVVDMHQVAKDPEGLLRRGAVASPAPEQTTRTLFDLNRYLNYCNELLAIISKVAALYVQEFPDTQTVSAVDQIETLCSDLSRRVWQKIMILDDVLDQEGSPPQPPEPQTKEEALATQAPAG